MSDLPSGPGFRGVGRSRLSYNAYVLGIRMLAENHDMRAVMRQIRRQFPDDHGDEGECPCTYNMVRTLKETRQAEIQAVREKLNKELGDLWISNARQRLLAIQRVFEDANRWYPSHTITVQEVPGDPRTKKATVVFKKDTDTMLKALRQAREELGVDAASRAAASLEDIVRRAERERGLEETGEMEVGNPEQAPILEHALLMDAPEEYRSTGDAPVRGLLDGAKQPDHVPGLTVVDDGHPHPPVRSTPTPEETPSSSED